MSQSRASNSIATRVADVRELAKNTRLYVLQPLEGEFPYADAGSHIDLHLANGLVRQYSLVMKNPTTSRYEIAIKLDERGRGGSSLIHSSLRVGDQIEISAPRNHFPLDEDAKRTLFVAGGIGITPIYSMLHRLRSLDRPSELYYACRSKADAAFLAELAGYKDVHFHFDDENDGRFLDVKQVFSNTDPTSNFYCCGPSPLMDAFEHAAASANVPSANVHMEYFTPKEQVSLSGSFTVHLAKSGKVLEVPEGRSILEVLVEAGIQIEHSCSEGICGTCETKVLSGIPDHRDSVLTPKERKANNTMMICCSRSHSPDLVLDV
jgi:ferredoxin-NADP reductase